MRQILLAFTLFALCFGAYAIWSRSHYPVMKVESGSGKAEIGGAFTLTDQNGKKVSDKDFSGKWMLVFFGFSHCPDVCPLGLATITKTLENLGDEGKNIVPVFITVDPKRDTPKVLKTYAKSFHPRLVALTGSPEELEKVQKDYKVFSAEEGEGEHAMMQHSSLIYLMNPKGEYVKHFTANTSEEALTDGIRGYVSRYSAK